MRAQLVRPADPHRVFAAAVIADSTMGRYPVRGYSSPPWHEPLCGLVGSWRACDEFWTISDAERRALEATLGES